MAAYLVLIAVFCGRLAAQSPSLDSEIRKIDSAAENPQNKMVVVAAEADQLKMHRNHLMLLRRQTGKSYGQIFVSTLKSAGQNDDVILEQTRVLNREIERKLKDTGESEEPRISPVLSVDTAADHNSAGTFYTVMPEVGIDSRHASLVASIPWYRNSGSTFSNAGIGDVYATGLLRTSVKRYDLASSLTIGFPTGDHALGLGAGKLTFDAAGTVVVNFGKIRPFVTAGFANSIFNIGYQRPYISDGNAAHFAGGAEFQLTGRLLVGVGGFAVRPQGEQAVVSRAMAAMPGNGNGTGSGNGMGAGNGMGNGRGQSGTPHVPVYAVAPQYSAPASDLQDHGANAWASFRLHQGVNLNFAVARSVPFQLTTVQVGLGFDLAHFLFPAGR